MATVIEHTFKQDDLELLEQVLIAYESHLMHSCGVPCIKYFLDKVHTLRNDVTYALEGG